MSVIHQIRCRCGKTLDFVCKMDEDEDIYVIVDEHECVQSTGNETTKGE